MATINYEFEPVTKWVAGMDKMAFSRLKNDEFKEWLNNKIEIIRASIPNKSTIDIDMNFKAWYYIYGSLEWFEKMKFDNDKEFSTKDWIDYSGCRVGCNRFEPFLREQRHKKDIALVRFHINKKSL